MDRCKFILMMLLVALVLFSASSSSAVSLGTYPGQPLFPGMEASEEGSTNVTGEVPVQGDPTRDAPVSDILNVGVPERRTPVANAAAAPGTAGSGPAVANRASVDPVTADPVGSAPMTNTPAGSTPAGEAPVAQEPDGDGAAAPSISMMGNIQGSMEDRASRVREQLGDRLRGIFEREPLGFDTGTLRKVAGWLMAAPEHIPLITRKLLEHGRTLGIVGSIVLLAFLGVVFYSLFGWKPVLRRLEAGAEPMLVKLSASHAQALMSLLRILALSLAPVVFLAVFSFIRGLTGYEAPWFGLIGDLMKLWAVGAFVIAMLRELFIVGHADISEERAHSLYRISRMVTFYVLFCVALLWSGEALGIPSDVLALVRLILSMSIVGACCMLLVKKSALMHLLPELPYRPYQIFVRTLDRYYFPVIGFTLALGIFYVFGYHRLAITLWIRTWAVAGSFLILMFLYHYLEGLLNRWMQSQDPSDEVVSRVYGALKKLLLFGMVTLTAGVILSLLGLYDPLKYTISFPLMTVGETVISLWTVIRAILVFIAVFFLSGLIRAYLEYKVYPAVGVDEGLAYSLNMLLNYVFLVLAILFALRALGIDLRMLLVFAGAAGLGFGLGLQNTAASFISGFALIFGRKVRKGDWIEVAGTLGYVQELGLRATKLRTRDNIEYLMPNNELTDNTIINYTLSDPEIRVHLPVGVSYDSKPAEIEKILLSVAEANPHISKSRQPVVWFTEFADSALVFELLIWVDVRQVSRGAIRSELYFAIFDALGSAGVEIPFPQRDLHIRSAIPISYVPESNKPK